MPRASLIDLSRAVGALIALVLLCGCDQGSPPPEEAREQSVASDASAPSRESGASSSVDEREKAARIARLGADIDAELARRTELQQQRAAIDARLVEHEEQGMAMLDSLKSQLQERARDGRDDAAFKTEAKAKLETVLAEDDALVASLREIDERIAAANEKVERLSAERKSLEEGKARQQ